MSISCDGPCRSSNDCAAGQPEHGGGWTPFDGASPPCSRTGTCCPPPHAGLWEPYDGSPHVTYGSERRSSLPLLATAVDPDPQADTEARASRLLSAGS